MTCCPFKNGCLDSWTWAHDPEPSVVVCSWDDMFQDDIYGPKSTYPRSFRGTKVLNCDAHYWEINLNTIDDSAPVLYVGVVRGKPLKPDKELDSLDDQEDARWGLSSKGDMFPHYIANKPGPYSQAFPKQTVIGVLLDRKEGPGTLSYYQDGVPLGVAFTVPNYLDYELFPAVWNITIRTDMKLERQLRSLNNLQERCRATIVQELSENTDIDLLNLPTATKDYLLDGYYDKQKSRSMISANISSMGSTLIRVLCNSYRYVLDFIMSFAS